MPKVDKQLWKYKEEDYVMSVEFEKRLRIGETIQSTQIKVLDVVGNDATAIIIEGGIGQIDGTQVLFSWLKDGGTKGQRYYVSVLAITQNDTLEYRIELEVR